MGVTKWVITEEKSVFIKYVKELFMKHVIILIKYNGTKIVTVTFFCSFLMMCLHNADKSWVCSDGTGILDIISMYVVSLTL